MSNTHDCLQRINEQLAEHNTRVSTGISLSDTSRELILVATVKRDDSVRKKPISLFASFCPFCGVSLAPSKEGGAG